MPSSNRSGGTVASPHSRSTYFIPLSCPGTAGREAPRYRSVVTPVRWGAMERDRLVKLSKRMSKALRHDPGRVRLTLDDGGWVPVEEFLAALGIGRAELDEVVAGNDKQRYAVERGADGVERIRANQGHSVPVDLGLAEVPPPDVLFHGTSAGAL